jgi:hypothetical protein
MRTVATIQVPRQGKPALIKLCVGDLSAIPAAEAVDVLVVSAFPNDYIPTRSSLIGALHRKGVSVEQLARDKALDLRVFSSCWLSKPVATSGLNFKQVLCFEPLSRGKAPEVVGDIFRSIIPIASGPLPIKRIAMPLVASGNQGESRAVMLDSLLDASFHWLSHGLQLESVLIATHDPLDEAMFLNAVVKYKEPAPDETQNKISRKEFDLFVSYCHQDKDETDHLVTILKTRLPKLRVFVDRYELKLGSAWQQEIFESLDASRKVLTVLSPAYLASKVCKEEYNIALCRNRDGNGKLIIPVYLRTADLPTYMRLIHYIDCREADRSKLQEASLAISEAIG